MRLEDRITRLEHLMVALAGMSTLREVEESARLVEAVTALSEELAVRQQGLWPESNDQG